jgi:hypothetical protein
VTLCPAGSTQPVAASGEVALGAAATQIVCDILLTNVTRRWPAAPAEGGTEAAGSVGEAAARAAAVDDGGAAGEAVPGFAVPGFAVAGADRAAADRDAAPVAGWPAVPVPPAAPAVATAVTGSVPLAAPLPRPAQPAVKVTAASAAAMAKARARHGRLPFPGLE